MEEEVKKDPIETNYLEAFTELKKNTVSKEAYDKALDENKKLIKSLSEFSPQTDEEPKVIPVDKDQLKENLFTKEMTNLDFIDQSLKLRKAIIDEGGKDPFVPQGPHQNLSDEEARAQRVAEGLQALVDETRELGEGSAYFTDRLQSRMKDTGPRKFAK